MKLEDKQRLELWSKGMAKLGLSVETVIEGRLWLLQTQDKAVTTPIAYFPEKPFDQRFALVKAQSAEHKQD